VTLPRRQFVHPRTGQLVVLSARRGQLLTLDVDGRRTSPADAADDLFLAAATATPLPSEVNVSQLVAVESDRYLQQGYVQLTKSRSRALVLADHEPFRTWHAVAAEVTVLADWWSRAWGAPHSRTRALCELYTGVTLGTDLMRLEFGGGATLSVELPFADHRHATTGFLRAFGAAHASLRASEFHAGLLAVGEATAREALGDGPRQLEPFLREDAELWWLAVDASGAETVYREAPEFVLVEQAAAEVIVEQLLATLSR
jgi:hypothetical protein